MAQASSAIGDFIIGVSQIGDPPFDWQQTILSQYSASTILLTYLDFLAQNLDVTDAVGGFYDNVWNIDTAVGWGLDFWGKIVGVSRVLAVTSPFFGFANAGDVNIVGFDQAPFYSGQSLTGNVSLSDDAFRQLILAKAAANISDCSIPSINQILISLFGASGICYVQDNGDMTMAYVFGFALSPVQISIIETAGILPRPTGVSVTIIQA